MLVSVHTKPNVIENNEDIQHFSEGHFYGPFLCKANLNSQYYDLKSMRLKGKISRICQQGL